MSAVLGGRAPGRADLHRRWAPDLAGATFQSCLAVTVRVPERFPGRVAPSAPRAAALPVWTEGGRRELSRRGSSSVFSLMISGPAYGTHLVRGPASHHASPPVQRSPPPTRRARARTGCPPPTHRGGMPRGGGRRVGGGRLEHDATGVAEDPCRAAPSAARPPSSRAPPWQRAPSSKRFSTAWARRRAAAPTLRTSRHAGPTRSAGTCDDVHLIG